MVRGGRGRRQEGSFSLGVEILTFPSEGAGVGGRGGFFQEAVLVLFFNFLRSL